MGNEFTPLGVGNISLKNGRSFQPDHREHDTGNRVDFRPVRIDKAPAPVNYKSPDYDRAATQRAIRAIQATGQAEKAARMFHELGPRAQLKGSCPEGSVSRMRDKLYCIREASGQTECEFGFDMRTGKSVGGMTSC